MKYILLHISDCKYEVKKNFTKQRLNNRGKKSAFNPKTLNEIILSARF